MDLDLISQRKSNISITLSNKTLKKFVLKSYLINLVVGFLIYFVAFSFFYMLKQKTLFFASENYKLLLLYLSSLFFGAIFSQKLSISKKDELEKILNKLYISVIISLGVLIILLYIFKINFRMPSYILGALFSGLVIESYYFILINKYNNSKISFVEHKKLSIRYLILDGLILTFFCYIEVLANIFPANFKEKEFLLLSIIYISWLISASTTHKFLPEVVSNSRWDAFELQVKFYFRIIALVVLSLLFLKLEVSNSVYFIKGLLGYSLVSSLISMFLFAEKIKNKADESTVVFLKAYEMNDPVVRSRNKNGKGKYSFDKKDESDISIRNKIQFEYLKEYSGVFTVLDNMLDLKSFDTRKSMIIKSDEPNDIISHLAESYELVVNLHVLNDQVKLNDYILDVRKSLVAGGVFVGALLPHHYRYRRYLKKYSFWMANTLYFFDFVWKRVLPKLPLTREIYSAFSQEKDRALSLAEGLGRLVYCGFKVLDLAVVDDVVYFAAAKNGLFKPVNKFFYSPVFKMKRIGKGGKNIYVYKLRTMYPYSEFIQDFIYEHNNLELGGKFKNDFRVPTWGKLFRKFWIDELPMLINWVKRDLKLVGVRPISDHYLSLYSEEHQERRKNFKPGLVPPFYADLPQTIEEIELSEKKYLDAYEKSPYKTDIKYFIKSINNIFLKNKRSA